MATVKLLLKSVSISPVRPVRLPVTWHMGTVSSQLNMLESNDIWTLLSSERK